MKCPNDRRLFEVHTGDGCPADRAHAAACPDCAARLRALASELGAIEVVLSGPMPAVRPARIAPAWRLAPVAMAALLLVAVLIGRNPPTPDATPAGGDVYALADEVASLVAGDVDPDASGPPDDATGTTAATSTCTYGDPLLGVGCDEPAVMQIAWR